MVSVEEYDKMSPEEREAQDKADREREATEQAALPYQWTQILGEVDVTVPVPEGTRARDLTVVLTKKKLSVGLKGKEPIMGGELCKEIKVDDSTWTLQDSKVVLIHLEKLNSQQWWENVIASDPKIDTKKIQPENSKLSELDGETRGMVEKMMFDQQQKALGKPTSDEMKKFEALEKFKKAHPEMDFSNAKIT